MTSPTSSTMSLATNTDRASDSGSGESSNLGLVITIVVCSLAGVVLFILTVMLAVLSVIIKNTRGRKRIREYSVAEAEQTNQRTQTHRTTRERVEMNKLQTINSGLVLVNNSAGDAPQLTSHDAVIQELQATLSIQRQNPPTSASNFRETSTNSTSQSQAINSTSTNTTIVVDIEDSGIMEEAVFLESETESDVLAKSSHLLNQHSRSYVATCGHGSHECTMTTTAGQPMNLIPHQKNFDSITGNGYPNNHRSNHKESESDSPGYVNITRQALVHTTEHSSTMQYSLSQPLLTECNQSPAYVNHTEIPFCQCRICRKSDNQGRGCVNMPTQCSLSQPLLNDNDASERGPLYVNHTQVQSSSQLNLSAESPSFKHQISAPAYAIGADEQASTNNNVQSDGSDLVHGYVNVVKGSEIIPLLECQKLANGCLHKHTSSHHHSQTKKSPSQSRSLPPRTQQSTTSNNQSSQEASNAQGSSDYYEDASSWPARTSQQTILTPTETVGRSKSSKSCSSTIRDCGYVNVTKPRSISQPTPVTADMLNASLIPPRTILRANFHQTTASNDNCSSVHTIPPRPRSKTTQYIHSSPPSSSDKLPSSTHPTAIVPAKNLQLVQSSETESKSSSGCSSGSSDQLDCITVEEERRHTHDKHKLKNSSRSACRERGCSCDLVGDSSYVVDGLESSKKSESVESLDMWPPVIPRRTELMFIVAHTNQPEPHNQKDLGGGLEGHTDPENTLKSMKMTVNTSYVKH